MMSLQDRKTSEPCSACCGQGFLDLLEMCEECDGFGLLSITCRACWNKLHPSHFRTDKKELSKTCRKCRDKSRSGEKTDHRAGLPDNGEVRVKLNVLSGNTKTGKIPVSMTSSPTCPTSCPHRNGTCYAESHFVGTHWRRLSKDGAGVTWKSFCKSIERLPKGQLWRHNEAGDLPGTGDFIKRDDLDELVEANRGKKGFTYTHKPVIGSGLLEVSNRIAIFNANKNGFAVNLSADDLEHADALTELGIAPVVVTVSKQAPKFMKTPRGFPVKVCPAQLSEKVTCESCGLCANRYRRSIIAFRAHGPGKDRIKSGLQLPLFEDT